MRKRFWILAALLVLSLLAAVTAMAFCEAREPEKAPVTPVSGYILTAVGEELGVFRDGELILRTGVRLESLRDVDRAMVEAGIPSDSYEEILMLLEDFGA